MTCRANLLLTYAVKQPSHSVVTFFLYLHTLQRILLEGTIPRLVLRSAPSIATHPCMGARRLELHISLPGECARS